MPQHAMKKINDRRFLVGVQIARVHPVAWDSVMDIAIRFGAIRCIKRFHSASCHPVRDEKRSKRKGGRWNVPLQSQSQIRQHSQAE